MHPDGQLSQRGYFARSGQIIDAALVAAPIQHFTKEDKGLARAREYPERLERQAKRRQKDLVATHTKKHGKGYHGYKLSISVDVRHKFIRKITAGTASEHDNTHFDEVLDEHNTICDLYAHRGATPASSAARCSGRRATESTSSARPRLARRSVNARRGCNKRIAKTRARVEQPCAQMRHMGGKLTRTIGQAHATVAMTKMATCHNVKRLAQFLDDGGWRPSTRPVHQ